ncbi:MAG TPA: Stk1 family PASTA domain-containing Ser/Thr kinase [Solirubrobacteraceae bacterium]|nr:Stk1 family PASTA domain-containing Ser/Thr kinase [Solirubrobacteraceae bacterium]
MSGIAQDHVVDGRYRLVSRLGSGGMADVWCADDLQLGRRVALKLLHRRFAEDEEFVERFRREASSAAGLQHPNVVSVYDRGEFEGTYYIAMEFLDGVTLKDLVRQQGPLEPVPAIDLAIQILRAARFAHKRGIIHRDLKPHNVIVDAEGRAKVTDFGIARAGASDMTETGSILGTAQYLSPEQAQGHAVSAQSDLYAIGIVLYEMLTGTVPFEGDSAVTIALKQVSEPPLPPSRLNPAVTPDLEVVVLRALAKEPSQRFADADEFITALEYARAGLEEPGGTATTAFMPVPAPPPGTAVEEEVVYAEPLREEREPRWWLWGLLAALLVAGAVVAALLLAGEEKKLVPRLVGADVAAAARTLRNEGFKPVVERVRNDAPADRVIAQDPGPGIELEVGEEVTLTVSNGPGLAGVPNVEGLTRKEARQRLIDAGFKVRERREESDEVEGGRVIEAIPAVGSQVEVGSTVTIVVSSGPERVEVPDVVDSTLDDARSELERAGLQVDVVREETEDADPDTVLGQDPAAGTEVEKDTTVTLTVAKEVERVEVPRVEGLTESEASERLSGAGLTVDIQDEPVQVRSQDGRVLGQSPAPGREVERGSSVTITVARFEPDLNPDPPETTPEPPPDEGADGSASGGAQG